MVERRRIGVWVVIEAVVAGEYEKREKRDWERQKDKLREGDGDGLRQVEERKRGIEVEAICREGGGKL